MVSAPFHLFFIYSNHHLFLIVFEVRIKSHALSVTVQCMSFFQSILFHSTKVN
ncbi:hypothetical protein Bca4012_010921 [Brassica carinata]